MIFQKKILFFRSLRVLYQNEDLEKIADKNKYDYITVISYRDLGLEKQGFSLAHKKIANIHLSGDMESILNGFARRTRQEIQKTYTIPELEFKIDDQNLAETYKLYREFESAQGRKPWKADTFNSGVKLFNAYYKGELIASVPCYDIFPNLQARAIFSKRLSVEDPELYKIIGYATRRLIYEICAYGKERGYNFFGLGPVVFSTPQKANVAQFKMFFGGKIEDEYTYTYISKRFAFLRKLRAALKL